MSLSINNDLLVKEAPQTEETQAKQISYKANYNNTFERNPGNDTFEKKNNTGKTVGAIAGLIAAAALVIGGICYHKGKPAEGVKSFKDVMKDGWAKLLKKSEAAAEETAADAGKKAAEAAENAGKDAVADAGKEAAEKAGKDAVADAGKEAADLIKPKEITEFPYGDDIFKVKDGKIVEAINKEGKSYDLNTAMPEYKEQVEKELERLQTEAKAEAEKAAEAAKAAKVEKPAAEAKKPEEVKPEEVKPEEVKTDAEAVKPEAEAKKPEEVKPEEVKPEEVKPEEVKPEEQKPE